MRTDYPQPIVVCCTVKKLQNTSVTEESHRRCYSILLQVDVTWCVLPSCSLILCLCDRVFAKVCLLSSTCLCISTYNNSSTIELIFKKWGSVTQICWPVKLLVKLTSIMVTMCDPVCVSERISNATC